MTIYRSRLEREGFHVESADNGLVAIEKLSQFKPCLVVLDLMLPMLDGLDVLKFIRDDEELKATPVLVLSNAYMADMAAKAMKAGANKGMLKTECTPAKFIETVRELTGDSSPGTVQASAANLSKDIVSSKIDEASQQKAREELLKEGPADVAGLREHCVNFVKTAGTPENSEHLNQLYQQVRFLGTRATLSECIKVAQLCCALEAMLFEILFKSSAPSPSALQTAAQAVDCLGRLFQNGETRFTQSLKARVLVVDDDPICNFAVVGALKRTNFEAISELDPMIALETAQANRFDIVLLDVNMPGLNGFEVCEKLRQLPAYKATPVIFVTSNGEFQNRAQSVLSGGNDLITKPISPLELALKVTMHLIEPKEIADRSQARIRIQAAQPAKPETNGHAHPHEFEHAGTKKAAHLDRMPEKNNTPLETLRIISAEIKLPEPAIRTIESLPDNRIHLRPNGEHHGMLENGRFFEKFTEDLARIIFDDNVPDMNVRLIRIALERHNVPELLAARHGAKAVEANNSFDTVVREVSRLIFGDQVSDMHVRLTHIALGCYDTAATVRSSVNNSPAEPVSNVIVNL